MRKINCSLTKPGSLGRAIEEIKKYRNELDQKTQLFVERLANIGVNIAMMTLATKGKGDSPKGADFAIKIDKNGNVVNGLITVSSESILFWEFGAGYKFNPGGSPNPKADEFGMGPGTYPGQTHVPDPGYWFYYEENGDSHMSYGTQATMPMYVASMEMIDNIYKVAKEVFRNG